ncbi:MAG TPA: hypothetical protein VGU20_02185 [Stellaceae bacterium]|nr:hypothetical protein [Stellaceae bacterium]
MAQQGGFFSMAQMIAPRLSREIQIYREMAESCRKMAAVSRRPGPLLLRAQAYEATALALEHGDKPA